MAALERFVLIVDDDAVFAGTLMRSLARLGVQAAIAHNRQDAVALAKQHEFSDVVLDLNLGEQSGLALLEPLRACLPNANMLMLTGYASIATTVQAIKLGADNYLAKPATTAAILKALDQDASPSHNEVFAEEVPMSVSRLEWEHIQRVLAEHQGNVSATARALNMHRRTLQRKLAKRPVGR
ncbi:MAG TPA: response regulator transcription factor [Limnobacter sp.]|nr:response regulator transcription factor [Limnobacter sp.]